jgi:hypothetical protein
MGVCRPAGTFRIWLRSHTTAVGDPFLPMAFVSDLAGYGGSAGIINGIHQLLWDRLGLVCLGGMVNNACHQLGWVNLLPMHLVHTRLHSKYSYIIVHICTVQRQPQHHAQALPRLLTWRSLEASWLAFASRLSRTTCAARSFLPLRPAIRLDCAPTQQ